MTCEPTALTRYADSRRCQVVGISQGSGRYPGIPSLCGAYYTALLRRVDHLRPYEG